MNWQAVRQCMQSIAGMKRDAAQSIMQLRTEVIASRQLTPAEKVEIHDVLTALESANLYGQISLVGKLKELLSRHAEFKAMYAEFRQQTPE